MAKRPRRAWRNNTEHPRLWEPIFCTTTILNHRSHTARLLSACVISIITRPPGAFSVSAGLPSQMVCMRRGFSKALSKPDSDYLDTGIFYAHQRIPPSCQSSRTPTLVFVMLLEIRINSVVPVAMSPPFGLRTKFAPYLILWNQGRIQKALGQIKSILQCSPVKSNKLLQYNVRVRVSKDIHMIHTCPPISAEQV